MGSSYLGPKVIYKFPLCYRSGVNHTRSDSWQAGAEVQMVVPSAMAFREKGICLENGDCLVKPGQDVRYDLKLMRVAVSP